MLKIEEEDVLEWFIDCITPKFFKTCKDNVIDTLCTYLDTFSRYVHAEPELFQDYTCNYNFKILVETTKLHKECVQQFEEAFKESFQSYYDLKGTYEEDQRRAQQLIANLKQKNLSIIAANRFDGSPDQWKAFQGTYLQQIHKNSSLSKVDKFESLRSCLKGKALETIEDIEVTAGNYSVAWALLKDVYNSASSVKTTNDSLLASKHVKSLLNLQSSGSSSSELHKLVNDAFIHTAVLKQLKQPVAQWNTVLVTAILQKVDENLQLEWQTHLHNNNFSSNSLDGLLKFLRNKASMLEVLDASKEPQKVHCIICMNDQHDCTKCPIFLAIGEEARYNLMVKNKICVVCLKPCHKTICDEEACGKCKQPHHTLLHHSKIANNPSKMLATLILPIQHEYDNEILRVRAVINTGDNYNYISKKFVDRFDLEVKEKISHNECTLKIVSSNLHLHFYIQCIVLQNLPQFVPEQPVTKSQINEIPYNIQLADPLFYLHHEVDVILGLNCYIRRLARSGVLKTKEGELVLTNTTFGWVVTTEKI